MAPYLRQSVVALVCIQEPSVLAAALISATLKESGFLHENRSI